MKNLAHLTLALVIISLLSPLVVSAQFGPIIDVSQCSGTLSFPEGEKYCTLCDGLNVVKNIINILITLSLTVAVLIIVYGGILIMVGGASSSKIEQGKKAIWSAIVGVAIILVAWLIINQIFFLIVEKNITGRPWNRIECPPEEKLGAISGPPTGPPGGVTTEGGGRQENNVEESNRVRDRLNSDSGGKITTNHDCPQTCLDGLSDNSINGILAFQKRSGCDLVISGGTEVGRGHSVRGGHLSGNKLDIRPACVDNFIVSPTNNRRGINGFEFVGDRSDGAPMFRDSETGHIYARETDHWDIQFTPN